MTWRAHARRPGWYGEPGEFAVAPLRPRADDGRDDQGCLEVWPMIRVRLNVGAVAQTRFGASAVWETAASLGPLLCPREHILHSRLRERLPRHPRFDMNLLAEVWTTQCGWTPDTLAPPPPPRPVPTLVEFDQVRATPEPVVLADLAQIRQARPDSPITAMTPDEFVDRLATALTGYWHEVLEPLWDRVVAIQEADIAYRTGMVASDGLAAAIAEVHPELDFEGDALTVDKRAWDHELDADRCGVWLLPSVFRWPYVAINLTGPVIGYGARGAGLVWEGRRTSVPALAGLIGRSRAAILTDLDIPRTTSTLAHRLHLAPATVSEHLSVLAASHLLLARRRGQRVLYQRTALGEDLVEQNRIDPRIDASAGER
ncbi:MAG: DUF5937 family protein [Kineosporiaceae bacterium]